MLTREEVVEIWEGIDFEIGSMNSEITYSDLERFAQAVYRRAIEDVLKSEVVAYLSPEGRLVYDTTHPQRYIPLIRRPE